MKLIDADALKKDVLDLPNCYNGFSDTYDKSLIIGLIDEQNVVDAVPVVRCKDCQYGYQFYDVQNGITDSWVECRNPNGLNHDAPEDGYCYCGERKTDE